eukprot:m.306910 g.306910  ORF g.306910 m.306910 type:complete len:508 (-) comp15927_c0_seq2:1607-3130(-)
MSLQEMETQEAPTGPMSPTQPKQSSQSLGKPLYKEPEVHPLIQLTLVAAVVCSGACVGYLGPKSFTDQGPGAAYISAAFPFFFILMLIEWMLITLSNFKSAAAQYDLPDSFGSVSAGTMQQLVTKVFFRFVAHVFVPYLGYETIYNKYGYRVLDENSWVTWVFALLAADFVYYWAHRFGHTIGLFWAGHQVHHSSEHYNLSTALRQSWWQTVYSIQGPLPFALVIPPQIYLVHSAWNTIYQFWVHTCLVRRLGPLEWVLSTPSHHRMHHDRRLHKNFGGFLIIWDRLFGTFLDEAELIREAEQLPAPPGQDTISDELQLFGIMQTVPTWLEPPFQFTGFVDLADKAKRSCLHGGTYLQALLHHLHKGPGWKTVLVHRPIRPSNRKRFRLFTDIDPSVATYYKIQLFATLTLALTVLITPQSFVDGLMHFGFIATTLASLALMCDGARDSYRVLEACRVIIGCTLYLPVVWRYSVLPHLLQPAARNAFGDSLVIFYQVSLALYLLTFI